MERNGRSSREGRALLLALLLAGLCLRALEAAGKSLWLDELHTLHAASGASVVEVIERVRLDLHPPLFFLLLHPLAGLDPHLLRWVSILASLATLLPLLALASAAGLSGLARTVLAGVFCAAPFQVMHGAELRSYALLGLCAATMAWAAFTSAASPRSRFLAFATATGVGLHLHYFALVAAAAIGIARLLVRPRDAAAPLLPWSRLVQAGALGVLAFLPWLVSKERWLLTDPGALWRREKLDTARAPGPPVERPGILDQDLAPAVALVPRTFAPMLGSLGPPVAGPARAATAGFLLACAVGAGLLLARARDPAHGAHGGALRGALLASAIAYALGLALCLVVMRRVADQYFAVAAWGIPLLAGAAVDAWRGERARRAFAAVAIASSLAAGSLHVAGASREDVREAVRVALREGQPRGAAYTAILWQPQPRPGERRWYPDSLPYRAYAPEIGTVEPEDVPPDGRPVVVVTRRIWPGTRQDIPAKWAAIRAGRELAKRIEIDESMSVWVFTAPAAR